MSYIGAYSHILSLYIHIISNTSSLIRQASCVIALARNVQRRISADKWEIEKMARAQRATSSLDEIAVKRARLEAELAELAQAEKLAREAAQDAGRPMLMAALERVRIPAMSKVEARGLAQAIAGLSAAQLAQVLAKSAAAN
jgi:hypothetical protein